MFFKKKRSDVAKIKLSDDQLVAVQEVNADDVTKKFCFEANADQYFLLYRDGQYLGRPCPSGGAIYPFSESITEKGRIKYRSAKIVVMSKGFVINMPWGTPEALTVLDPVTKKPFRVRAHGTIYVGLEPSDAGRSAVKFYTSVMSQRNPDEFRIEAIRDFLRDLILGHIGEALQNSIDTSGISLENMTSMPTAQLVQISKQVGPVVDDIFYQYGLSLVRGGIVRPGDAFDPNQKDNLYGSIVTSMDFNPINNNH